MALRSLTQIITDAINYLKSKRPQIATFSGTVTRDVVIESPAQEFSNVYTELEHTQKLSSLVYAAELTVAELDAIAANYNMIRLEGRAAFGTITFRIRNYTTSNANINIPLGTVVGTQNTLETPRVTYTTTQAGSFVAAQAPIYFNPNTGFYETTVSIVAEQVGEIGNVGAGTVTQIVSSLSGIDSITNTVAMTGGVDIESNTDFGARIQIKLSGNNIGTPAGIESLVRENVNVLDVAIVTPNDPEMLRDEFGGSVDVYVTGQVLTSGTETKLYTAAGVQEFVLGRQPAAAINSLTGIVGGGNYTFIEGTDFNFVLDTNTLYTGSSRMANKVVFNIGGTNPDNNTNIIITYTYNSLITELQASIDNESNHIVTADILVRESIEATIDIVVGILLYPGFITADVVADVQTALTQYINALGLGNNIDRSDIVGVIEGIEGVDQVDLTTLILSKNGTPIPSTQQRLTISKTEYPQANTITVTTI